VDLAETNHVRVPKNELTTIVEYHKAMTMAVSLALKAALKEEEEECSAREGTEGTCAVLSAIRKPDGRLGQIPPQLWCWWTFQKL